MRSFFILWICVFLCGCSFFHPFVDARKEAGKIQTIGQSQPSKPAVCYNPLWTEESEISELAEKECQKQNKRAVFVEKTYFSCSLFAPNTAFYECQK